MNHRTMPRAFVLLSLSLSVCLGVSLPASASEIWITPANLHADKAVGNWAATEDGDTYFTFGVPEDLSGFTGARVLVIGSKRVRSPTT